MGGKLTRKIMEKIRKTVHKNKEILIVDYSDCRGDSLIEVFEQAKNFLLTEGKKFPILTVFNNNTHISPAFMRHVEKELDKYDAIYIDRQAIIGLTQIQEWIVKGLNLWYKRQIFSFNSMEKAIEYLVKE
jgi:hypothetical protein